MTIGADLDAKLATIPAPFDASTITLQIATLTSAVKALQTGVPPPPPPPVNHPPIWLTFPVVNFTQGKASSFPFAGLVSDADGDQLSFTFAGTLPAGVTFDGPGKRLVYDGIGAVGESTGNTIVADDGRPA